MNIRHIRADDINGIPLWAAEEMCSPDDVHFWICTGIDIAGMLRFPHMANVISVMLQKYPATHRINTSWGRIVHIDGLIPDAIAKLAVKALAE